MNPDLDAMKQIARAVRDTKFPVSKMAGMTNAEFLRHAQHLQDQGLAVVVLQDPQVPDRASVVRRLTDLGELFAGSD